MEKQKASLVERTPFSIGDTFSDDASENDDCANECVRVWGVGQFLIVWLS